MRESNRDRDRKTDRQTDSNKEKERERSVCTQPLAFVGERNKKVLIIFGSYLGDIFIIFNELLV